MIQFYRIAGYIATGSGVIMWILDVPTGVPNDSWKFLLLFGAIVTVVLDVTAPKKKKARAKPEKS